MRCHYDVFELPRNATIDEIKKQYKKLALKYHPDKNIGNEEVATQSFKELQASYAVLSDPHERKWYDDHRESILRGGDGTSGSADSGFAESPLINLWKYFNAGCYSGFDDDNPQSFYNVYGNLFHDIHVLDFKEQENFHEITELGNSTSLPSQINQFYAHWTNFVSNLSFSWEDKYNTTEAPNRLVKRAMEKENKKFRDVARKKYIETVRELATYVRRRDPRVAKMESEKRKRDEEEAQKRIQLKKDVKERKKLQREQWRNYQETDEEREARERERKGVFLFANEDDESHKSKKLYDNEDADEFDESISTNDRVVEDMSNNISEEIGDTNPIQVIRCEICRKDFKAESQLQQHLSSKAHKKKVQEINKKSKTKGAKTKNGAKDAPEVTTEMLHSPIESDCDDDTARDPITPLDADPTTSKTSAGTDSDNDEEDEDKFLQRLTQKIAGNLGFESSEDEDTDEVSSKSNPDVTLKETAIEDKDEDVSPHNPDNHDVKDENPSKVCKICGYIASIFQHIQQTGHAALKDIESTPVEKKRKGKKRS